MHTTLTQFLANHLRHHPHAEALQLLILQTADACIQIAQFANLGPLGDAQNKTQQINVQGEQQIGLDVFADKLLIEQLSATGLVAGFVSEEQTEIVIAAQTDAVQKSDFTPLFLVIFDPLDGSSNVSVNTSVGTIFSILPAKQYPPTTEDFLQAGYLQLAAGYVMYGPATILVLTVGDGTYSFTLQPETKQFIQTSGALSIAPDANEYAINVSNMRFWEPPIQRYIADCNMGVQGNMGRDFNMRWVASMVADVHRIFQRGGVYLYPKDNKQPSLGGRLRLLYEANPIAFLIEQAGGLASTGRMRLQYVQPQHIHERVAVIAGAANEVKRIEEFYLESGRTS
jgi:fructose-1,6-bisphosphatase I / sedoheptulose-1,7-bisphosphatase